MKIFTDDDDDILVVNRIFVLLNYMHFEGEWWVNSHKNVHVPLILNAKTTRKEAVL